MIIKKLVNPKTLFINTPHGPFMAHNLYSFPQKLLKFLYTFLQKLFLNKLYKIIIQVNPEQKNWIIKYRINENKIKFLPNGINFEKLNLEESKNILKDFGIARKFVISFIGRYEEYKGLQDLLKVMPELIKIQKNLKLITIGAKGNHLPYLEELVEELKLSKHVEILVNPSDDIKKAVLNISKIFIMPSKWEAFGIGILEAMSLHNAIVSTNTEGGQFLVTDDLNGFLYDFADTETLITKLERLIKDKILLNKMIKINYEKSQEFLWKDIAINYNLLIQELYK